MTCVGGPRRKGQSIANARLTWSNEQRYRADRTSVITDRELNEALSNANDLRTPYFCLRAKAVISLIRLSGKRRGEIAMVPLENFKVVGSYLEVTFILEKKRKSVVLNKVSTKRFLLSDPLVVHILEYLAYVEKLNPKPMFWLPSGKTCFGSYVVYPDAHVSGKTVFNILRDCSDKIWPHLGRETAASDVIQVDDSINAIFKVQETLDLTNFQTAFNYVKRFSKQVITRQAVN